MLTLALGAAVAGLAGTPHCMGMCGPFALLSGGGRGFWAWHLGRISTYGVLGALAGGLGATLPGPAWLGTALAAGLVVVFAAAFAGLLPEPKGRLPGIVGVASKLAQDDRILARLGFGIAGGLLPCGLLYATLGLAVAAGSAGGGATVMLAFGVATTQGLLAVAWGGKAARHRLSGMSLRSRRLLAVVLLVTGLGTVALRAVMHVH